MRFILLMLFMPLALGAQDRNFVLEQVEKLAAPSMAGRGYVKGGDKKAARYIVRELKKAGAEAFEEGWLQPFTFPVNTFPGDMEVILEGLELEAGKDYIVAPGTPDTEGTFPVVVIDVQVLRDSAAISQIITAKGSYSDKFVLLDERGLNDQEKELFRQLFTNPFNAAGLILVSEKLTWSVSIEQAPFPVIEIAAEAMPESVKSITVEIEARLEEHDTQNVIGYIPGTVSSDSFIVYTAHYDHLGMMGREAVFPGANDNASGIAFLLDLAHYYHRNPLPYPVVFMFFAAEEAGLIGSYYYTEHPVFPLEKIQVLVNLDLMGNGTDGIMVVNGTVFPGDIQLMKEINATDSLVKEIGVRGKAANSDHYFFTEKGVKSFFIYTLGGSKHYHDVFDQPGTIHFEEHTDLFNLITKYIKQQLK